MTLAFLIKNLFTVVFAKFCILPLLLNTVFIHDKVIEHLCSYLATFLITAAIKVFFKKTVQLVTVDVT